MRKKIAVLTATRAEYGLLRRIIIALNNAVEFEAEVVVTGAHLSPEFGLTYQDIQNDHIPIARKIEILLSSDTPTGISKSMGLAMISFAEYFDESMPDALMVLGDRYETLAVCCAAMNARIPIVHLYGGETTEGAVDEAIRHSITKMSYLHFTATEQYRRRVIQLGEHPDRVFTIGAMGIENILTTKLLSKEMLEESISFSLDWPYAVVTFHPVTLESESAEVQFTELLNAFAKHGEMKYIFTKANADTGGRVINQMIEEYVSENDNAICFESLGSLRYLSAVKYSSMVIGNSSSGLLEVPSLKIPTINIGDRQKGRMQADSVIQCPADAVEIDRAMQLACSKGFRGKIADVKNPYGDGKTSERIVEVLKDTFVYHKVDLKKKFYDLPMDGNVGGFTV